MVFGKLQNRFMLPQKGLLEFWDNYFYNTRTFAMEIRSAGNCLCKFNNETLSLERSNVIILNFNDVSHLALVFLLLILNMYLFF